MLGAVADDSHIRRFDYEIGLTRTGGNAFIAGFLSFLPSNVQVNSESERTGTRPHPLPITVTRNKEEEMSVHLKRVILEGGGGERVQQVIRTKREA